MAPGQKVAVSGGTNAAKSAVASQKRSVAAPRGVRKPKAQPKCPRYLHMLSKPFKEEEDEEEEEERVVIGRNSKHPIELKAPTSLAARKRRRATLSMAEILAESSREDETPTDHAAGFFPGSTALYTWGPPTSQPVPAVLNERRHKGLRGFGLRRGKSSAFVKFMFDPAPAEGGQDSITLFRFMDLPLEIRWKIYGYLLIHPKPILLHADWKTVHAISPQEHAILRASKQVLLESTQFLYEKNVFHAVINERRLVKSGPTHAFIKKKFLPYLKNVIVECRFVWSSTHPKINMVEPIAACINTLVMNEALLDSLTFIITPVMEFAMASTALVFTHPIIGKPIPEYFRAPASKIMRVIPKLRCKVFNIIIRMPSEKGISRILVSLNLRGLPVNQEKGGWFSGEPVAKFTARKLAEQVKADLLGLEKRIQDVFQDSERAIREGKARLMREDETVADGMRLASRD